MRTAIDNRFVAKPNVDAVLSTGQSRKNPEEGVVLMTELLEVSDLKIEFQLDANSTIKRFKA